MFPSNVKEATMIRMRWMPGLASAWVVVAVGCGSTSPQAAAPGGSADVAPAGPAQADVEEDESMADLKEHHRHHNHGGVAMFIAMSLDSLGTTPDENAAITKIQGDIRAKMQPAHDAEKAALLTIA